MLIELYLFIFSLGFLSFILSFIRPERYLFAIFSMVLFSILLFASFNIEINYCGLTTSNEYSCHKESFNDLSLVALNLGLALVSLVYMIVCSFDFFKRKEVT